VLLSLHSGQRAPPGGHSDSLKPILHATDDVKIGSGQSVDLVGRRDERGRQLARFGRAQQANI
jgi:hypothetical protein